MKEPTVLEATRGAVRILTLNRPESRNALNGELVEALTGAVLRAAREAEIRTLVLTGSGRSFCAGADLKSLQSLQEATPESNAEDGLRLLGLYRSLATCPKPVIAAVNGPALAGGCGLATLCDLILAEPEASFGYPEVRIGFVAAMVSVILARQIGDRAARELLIMGTPVSSERARELGLVNRVVPRERLLEEALSLAEATGAGSPDSLAYTKELLWHASGLSTSAALDLAVRVNLLARTGPDMHEGLAAFFEKRRPNWKPS